VRSDAPYRSWSSKVWLKSKNPASEAVRREREEEWRIAAVHYQAGDFDFNAFEKAAGLVGARAHQAARSFGQEWLDYRAGLGVLEAGLRDSHPDLAWLDGMKAFRAEADAGIARRRAAARKSG
jgi:hypothetical protein